ncbi:MAG: HypC/HybG/HupF family hydrogenase formation chaperone [Pseudonocardiaceae bacterium]
MCLGIPGQILEFAADEPLVAIVDVAGARREVNTTLFDGESLQVGEWILIHMGFVLERMSESEARDALRFMEGSEAYVEELLAGHDPESMRPDRPGDAETGSL